MTATVALSGADAGNYSVPSTASTTASITAKSVTAAIAASNKVYDGTTTATITSCALTGAVSGDSVSCSASNATFDTPAVGTGKTVTATVALAGTDASNYALSSTTATTTADITRADQTITFGALADKTYGDADFGVSATASCSLAVSFTASGNCTVASSTVHITGAGSCTVTAHQTGDANYDAAPDVAQCFSIAARPVTASITASDKVYDGTASASITGCVLSGVLAGDAGNVGCVATGGAFADKNVGAGKAVTATVALSGAGAGNYALTSSAGGTVASITARGLTATIAASDKVYDGTTSASITSCTLAGVVGVESVTCNATNGQFSDAERRAE